MEKSTRIWESDTVTGIEPLILIIDHESEPGGPLEAVLHSLKYRGFRVIETSDGKDGLLSASLISPHLILLALGLPDIDGVAVCRRLKANDKTSSIPVIFIAHPQQVDRLPEGFKAGGVDFICKPLQLEDLLRRVNLRLKLHAAQLGKDAAKIIDLNPSKKLDWKVRSADRRREQRDKLLSSKPSIDRRIAAELQKLIDRSGEGESLLQEVQVARIKLGMQSKEIGEARKATGIALERYLELFYYSPLPYFMLRVDGVIQQTNYRGADLLDCQRCKLSEQNFRDFVHVTYRAAFSQLLENVFAAKDKNRQAFELRLLLSDAMRWVKLAVSLADVSGMGGMGALALVEDITEQRQLEMELAQREHEFRTLVENSPDIIIRYDTHCRRVYANQAYMAFFNIANNEVLGKTPKEYWLLDKPSPVNYVNILQRVIANAEMEELELERVDAQGRKKCYAMNLVPEIDRYGEVCSVLSVSRDISELKAGQQRLEESGAQLRSLTVQREETREDERKRIARELHDELGQRLTALRLDISRLRLRFGQENPALLEQVLEMVAAVDATIHVVRNVAARLRPAVLDMGIVSALEWLTADFGKRSEINCTLLIPCNDIHLDDTQSTVIFRIVQESLTNIIRHAEAKNVQVGLIREHDSYLLEIQDDGKGFDPCARQKLGSFGLLGIQERVLMLGGEFGIVSSPGRGVKLSVRLTNAIMI